MFSSFAVLFFFVLCWMYSYQLGEYWVPFDLLLRIAVLDRQWSFWRSVSLTDCSGSIQIGQIAFHLRQSVAIRAGSRVNRTVHMCCVAGKQKGQQILNSRWLSFRHSFISIDELHHLNFFCAFHHAFRCFLFLSKIVSPSFPCLCT